jgi:type I restriction enzyme S subunit
MECTQNRSENMSEKVTTEKSKTEKAESLPEGWKRVRLGEVVDGIRNGFVYKYNEIENEGIPVTRIETISNGKIDISKVAYLKEKNKKIEKFILIPGDILFSHINSIEHVGKCAIYNGKPSVLIHGMNLLLLRTKKEFYSNLFLYMFLNMENVRNEIRNLAGKAVNQVSIKVSELEKFLLPLPPLPEQQKIAEILETVDNAIEKTDAIIEKYRRIKKGLMADLLTGKIRLIPYGHSEAEGEESPLLTSPEAKKFVIGEKTIVAVPNQRWKDSPIGTIPADWEVAKLGEVIRKIVDNRGRTPPIFEEGVELIETNCITDKDKKHPDFSKIRKYVNRYIYNTWFRSGHPEINDILIATVGNVGSAAIMNVSRGCIAQNLVALKLNENVIPDFVYYLFISEYFYKQVFAVLMMAAQPSLKLPHLLNFVFPLPPLPEQQLIADVLSQVDEVIEKEIQYKEKLERIKKGLMEDLLTGKVRVNNLIKEDIQNDTKIS